MALITHGKSKEPIYWIWHGIHGRCYQKTNGSYPWYGGKGITVCEEWKSFDKFYEDMGDRPTNKHSIDRIDCSKGYNKDNCRWSTREEQDANRNPPKYLYKNEMITVKKASSISGFTESMIRKRMNRGYSLSEAIDTPKSKTGGFRSKTI